MPLSKPSPPQSFLLKKKTILDKLAVPSSEYDDLSPKGSIDEGVRDLIDEINEIEGCVTTSSCAGRISVFVEGKKHSDDDGGVDAPGDGEVETRAGVGGKGGGGRWLFVSHDPLNLEKSESLAEAFSMHHRSVEEPPSSAPNVPDRQRWAHFKFEPMILHILTASLEQAQIVLSAALQAGFRESGAINLLSSNGESATPMVAVRSMGLSLESIIGYGEGAAQRSICTTSEESLETLVQQANNRFTENTKRIERFRSLLKRLSGDNTSEGKRKGQEGDEWEDPQVRRDRKKAEGLAKSQAMSRKESPESASIEDGPNLGLLDQIIA